MWIYSLMHTPTPICEQNSEFETTFLWIEVWVVFEGP